MFGVASPVLLLPHGITSHLTPPQLVAIVAHELWHVHRRDNLAASIHMTVEAVFWFHPLVWSLGARLLEERERACDEEVLRMGSEPQVYAEGLLRVCELCLESPVQCVAGVTGGNLRRRIETIMTNHVGVRLNFAKKAVLSAAGQRFSPCRLRWCRPMPHRAGQDRSSVPSGVAARPQFEVTSVKPSKTCGDFGGPPRAPGKAVKTQGRTTAAGISSPERFNQCSTLEQAIRLAYVIFANGRSPDHAVYGNAVPIEGWIRSDLYQINAKAEGAASAPMMRGPMMQTLLEDRFRLKVHRQTREGPVDALTVAQGGPRLRPSEN